MDMYVHALLDTKADIVKQVLSISLMGLEYNQNNQVAQMVSGFAREPLKKSRLNLLCHVSYEQKFS